MIIQHQVDHGIGRFVCSCAARFLVVACAAALTSSLAFAGLGSASGAVSSDVRVGSFNVVGVNNDTNASG